MTVDITSEWFPKNKTCIVGIGETEYTRWGRITRPEFQLACEAILRAIADAGLTVKDIDGICSYAGDRNEALRLATELGIPQLRFSNMYWGGGGGGSMGAVMNASIAVATGVANYVAVFRALAQGQFGRFGQARAGAGQRVGAAAAFRARYGYFTAAQQMAIQARRHMHLYGTTSRQFGAIAVACYKHAQRNPRAVMYGRPITIEEHQNSRMIADPLRLYDCCQETDGSAAVILTSAERARDLKQRPVYLVAASQGMGFHQSQLSRQQLDEFFTSDNLEKGAADLWKRAGITPKDVDVAQIYENFTSMTLQSIENHGFCKRGEGGAFVEGGRLEWPDGELPLNTSGGNLAEAYTHGFELVNEAVRQLRGTSTCQVEGAEICFANCGTGLRPISAGDMALNSNIILRR